MKTLLLVDTFWHGHHPLYFKLFTRALLNLGYRVYAFCAHPHELYKWGKQELPEKIGNLNTYFIETVPTSKYPVGRIRRAKTTLARWEGVTKALLEVDIKPDLVIFPCIEPYLSPYLLHSQIDKIFPYSWAGLYCGSTYLRVLQPLRFIRLGWLDADEALKSTRCKAIAVQDEQTIAPLQNKLNAKPIIVFPNTADDCATDRSYPILDQIKLKAKGRKIIGLLGSQGKRKGFLTLLEMAEQAQEQNWYFLFAGEFSSSSFNDKELRRIENHVQANPDNCFFLFERIPGDAQFHALVEICDVLFTVYEKYPSTSQMLTLAAMFEKPVIANDTFWIADKVNQYNLGLCIPEGDQRRCQDAINQLCDSTRPINHWLDPKFQAYRNDNSMQRFQEACYELVSSALEKDIETGPRSRVLTPSPSHRVLQFPD